MRSNTICHETMQSLAILEGGGTWTDEERQEFVDHLESCPGCKESLGAVVVLERWLEGTDHEDLGELPSSEESWRRLQKRLEDAAPPDGSAEEFAAHETPGRSVADRAEAASRTPLARSRSAQRVQMRSWLSRTSAGLAAAASIVLVVWLTGSRVSITSQHWGDIADRSSGPGRTQLELQIGGKAGPGWIAAVAVLESGSVQLIPFARDGAISVWTDGRFQASLEPCEFDRQDLPTHLVVLISPNEITREGWAERGVERVNPGVTPQVAAKLIAEPFEADFEVERIRTRR